MDVPRLPYGCFRKEGYPQIIHFNEVFHYKPSILGFSPYFWKHAYHFQGKFTHVIPWKSSTNGRLHHWLVVSTHLKNIRQNWNLPQIGVKINKYLKPPPRLTWNPKIEALEADFPFSIRIFLGSMLIWRGCMAGSPEQWSETTSDISLNPGWFMGILIACYNPHLTG